MKSIKTILISFFVGVVACAVFGLFVFVLPANDKINTAEAKSTEWKAKNANLGEQLGKEVKNSNELRKLLSEKEKEIVAKDAKIKYLNKTIFTLNNIISQGHATPNLNQSDNPNIHIYNINDEYFTGTITITSTETPQGVDYIIKLKNIDFEVTWSIIQVKDGYKVVVYSKNKNIVIKNNDFFVASTKKTLWQQLHGEILVGFGTDGLSGEVIGGYKYYRLGVGTSWGMNNEREYKFMGGFGF